mmetsp:Transcript_14203/g.23633  ORF Transcript_14203/g.23633 Transcript_14203/m.23633 type:complete len:102 (-) Transcript_14203:4-309(-)
MWSATLSGSEISLLTQPVRFSVFSLPIVLKNFSALVGDSVESRPSADILDASETDMAAAMFVNVQLDTVNENGNAGNSSTKNEVANNLLKEFNIHDPCSLQ